MRDDRRIVRLVLASQKITAREVKEQLQLHVGLEIIGQRLHKANLFGLLEKVKLVWIQFSYNGVGK